MKQNIIIGVASFLTACGSIGEISKSQGRPSPNSDVPQYFSVAQCRTADLTAADQYVFTVQKTQDAPDDAYTIAVRYNNSNAGVTAATGSVSDDLVIDLQFANAPSLGAS